MDKVIQMARNLIYGTPQAIEDNKNLLVNSLQQKIQSVDVPETAKTVLFGTEQSRRQQQEEIQNYIPNIVKGASDMVYNAPLARMLTNRFTPEYMKELSMSAPLMFAAGVKNVGVGKMGQAEVANIVKRQSSKLPQLESGARKLAYDIVKTDPILNTKRAIPVTDIHGNKSIIPQGEAMTPYELKGNKYLLKDGKEIVVNKNQYQNVKGNAIKAEAKPFAPELEGTEETVKGFANMQPDRDALAQEMFGKNESQLTSKQKIDFETEWGIQGTQMEGHGPNTAKYSQYQLPGGENYREILIKAPENAPKQLTDDEIAKLVQQDPANAMKLAAENDKARQTLFKSAHWDEPNVISHLRLNDRIYIPKERITDKNGVIKSKAYKVTFMEELQSDWAREARANKTTTQHPLLKNWQEPTIKRALKDAVDNNSDYFSWTTGAQQQARYNLSKQVDNIEWDSGKVNGTLGRTIDIQPKSGDLISIIVDKNGIVKDGIQVPNGWSGKRLDEVIGKGIGEKIMTSEKGKLSGEGLNIGGEWANNLYDKQVKDIVEKVTGGKVEVLDMGLPVEKGNRPWYNVLDSGARGLTDLKKASQLKIGMQISQEGSQGTYIITDILGDGKFKAVKKDFYIDWKNSKKVGLTADANAYQETFDISQKTTTQQAIKLTPEIKAKIRGEAPKLKQPSGVNPAQRALQIIKKK